MEKLFKLKENGTAVKTEVVAGVTTFLAMAYILAVNPSMLGAAGMDSSAVLLQQQYQQHLLHFLWHFLQTILLLLLPVWDLMLTLHTQ